MSPGGEAPSERGSKRPQRERKSLLLRLDPAVHEALMRWAADDLRSVNAQIEVLLRDALKRAGREVAAAPIRRPGRPRAAEHDVEGQHPE